MQLVGLNIKNHQKHIKQHQYPLFSEAPFHFEMCRKNELLTEQRLHFQKREYLTVQPLRQSFSTTHSLLLPPVNEQAIYYSTRRKSQ